MSKKIFWDAGHGGTDPGAIGNGLKEKELTLKIVKYAMEFLNVHYTGFEQRASRTNDDSLTLNQRTDAANNWGANILVSVHINSAMQATANGFESFVYTTPSAASVALQNVLHADIFAAMKAFGVYNDRDKKRANLHMVRESKMPAVLTECLFIINKNDANKLANEAFIMAVGNAHAVGVAKYLGLPLKAKEGPKMEPKNDYAGTKAEPSIKKAIAKGVMVGYEDGSFKPNDNLTRGQMAMILDRLGLLGK